MTLVHVEVARNTSIAVEKTLNIRKGTEMIQLDNIKNELPGLKDALKEASESL